MSVFIDLTGQKFGRWTILERTQNSKAGGAMWLCRCYCGREGIVQAGHLRSGKSKGCLSCHVSRKNKKHGQTGTRLYRIWKGIISRCENLNDTCYKYYGKRGISICPRWRNDFQAFRKWALANGYEEGLTIDRIDNDKGYYPDNCQFLTKSENSLKAWQQKRRKLKCQQPMSLFTLSPIFLI